MNWTAVLERDIRSLLMTACFLSLAVAAEIDKSLLYVWPPSKPLAAAFFRSDLDSEIEYL